MIIKLFYANHAQDGDPLQVVQVACLSMNATTTERGVSSPANIGWQLAPVAGASRRVTVDSQAALHPGGDPPMVASLMASARAGLCPVSTSTSFSGGAFGAAGGMHLSPGETAPLYLHLISPALIQDCLIDVNGAAAMNSSVSPAVGGEAGAPTAASGPTCQLDVLHPGGILKHILAPPSSLPLDPQVHKPQQRRKKEAPPAAAGGVIPPPSTSTLTPITYKGSALVMSDPPVDLVVAWQIQAGHRGAQLVRHLYRLVPCAALNTYFLGRLWTTP